MKYLCGACERLVEIRLYRVDAGALVLTCSACGQETRSGNSPARPAEEPAPRAQLASTQAGSNVVELRGANRDSLERARAMANEGPFVVPVGRCVKCISPRADHETSCRACGADFSLITADTMMPPTWMQTGWAQLLTTWGELERHDALVVSAMEKGDLPALGRLYRLFLARVPDDALARRGREEVVRRASVPALTSAPLSQDPSPPTWQWVLGGSVALGAIGALVMLLRALMESRG